MKRIVYRWILAGLVPVVLAGILIVAPNASAQPERSRHVQFKASVAPADPFSDQNAVSAGSEFAFRRGETFLVTIEGTPEPGWHTYPVVKKSEDQSPVQLSKLSLKDSKYFAALWPVTESEPELVDEGAGGGKLYEYKGPFTWTLEVLVRPDAPAGQFLSLDIALKLQVCAGQCVWEDHTLTVPVRVSSKDALPLTADVEKSLQKYDADIKAAKEKSPRRETVKSPASPTVSPESFVEELKVIKSPNLVTENDKRNTGLWGSIVTAVLGGFISLLTPCVFPMIPVTVSFFLKQSERNHHRPLTMAAVYCATIVTVLTVGGIGLVRALQIISQHYITNIFLTGVFVFFALSLLGMYEITLPSGLANLTGAREGKGGLVGIVFMALTFSIISFACVGPIYGAFITLEASQSSVTSWLQRILGPLAFSLAFASPFFVLALFPSLLRSMPKSGSWMNSVKVVMGFLELAAAIKFVRAAELSLLHTSKYFTFDLCLGVYIALSVACGLYLLNVYRLPHDHEAAESIGVPRLLFGLAFLSFAFYLLPGMFKGDRGQTLKPSGIVYEWTQSFLLPDDQPSENSGWQVDLAAAMTQAERERKPIFIDFTGQTCTNCKLNESRFFSQPPIMDLFQKFVTVRLYTDYVPSGVSQVPEAEGSAEIRARFGNDALPFYVVANPKGKTLEAVAVFDKNGTISSVEEFSSFLNRALAAAR
ncbi:MAG TPA: cytochrome c biogenesis protein CcdA [Gemmataceae bacterium]